MNLESMYQDLILDHYKHPHGKGLIQDFDVQVHHVNPTCGDEIDLQVRKLENSDGFEIHYENQGCSISQASASIMFDQLNGKSFSAGNLAVENMISMMQRNGRPDEELLGDGIALEGVAAYPARVKCALLAWLAWKDAIIQAQSKN